MTSSTQSLDESVSATGAPVHERTFLTVALHASAPMRAPARYALDDVQEVTLGRASRDGAELGLHDGRRRLALGIDDRRMSSQHARLWRSNRGWVLEDRGSKNGTYVDRARLDRATLRDTAIIETGSTFLVFRRCRAEIQEPDRLHGSALDAHPVGLRTMCALQAPTLARVRQLAAAQVPVLVHGETGTGKELVARALHRLSGRPGALIPVNCGAIPRDLVQGELLGYRKGAFSGAVRDHPGLVRAAHQGTLFLDEIGDLGLDSQVALLRVLQESEITALGTTQTQDVDVRFVSATHRDLDALIANEVFREDLFARIAGAIIRLLPLRRRKEDLGLLVRELLHRHAGEAADGIVFEQAAARGLFSHDWPRNVRELETSLQTALAVGQDALTIDHLGIQPSTSESRRADEPDRGEKTARLRDLLTRHRGNLSAVARELRTSRSQLHRLLNRHGIDVDRFRG